LKEAGFPKKCLFLTFFQSWNFSLKLFDVLSKVPSQLHRLLIAFVVFFDVTSIAQGYFSEFFKKFEQILQNTGQCQGSFVLQFKKSSKQSRFQMNFTHQQQSLIAKAFYKVFRMNLLHFE
jgi:hypothetical protein